MLASVIIILALVTEGLVLSLCLQMKGSFPLGLRSSTPHYSAQESKLGGN